MMTDEHNPATSEPEAEKTKSKLSLQDRRALVTGLVAALAAGGLVLVPKSEAPKAQLFGGDGGIDLGPFEDFFELFERVVQLVQFPTPGRVLALINEMLGLLEGSDGTFIGIDDPAGPMEESFPVDAVLAPDEQGPATMRRAELIRSRVDQSLRINGAAVQTQGEIATEEEAIVATAMAGDGEGFALATLLQGILLMQQQTNLRLGQMSFQTAALSQQLADPMLLQSNFQEQGQQAFTDFLRGAGQTIDAAVERQIP
jgi:hypothetical protein